MFSRCLDEEGASSLESDFSEEEVKEAIFSIDRDKSPGPNGFFFIFYQDCWEIVKDDLMNVFKEFHGSSIINKSTNATIIVLVHKKEDVSDFSDFQPISRVCRLYKMIGQSTSSLHITLRRNH